MKSLQSTIINLTYLLLLGSSVYTIKKASNQPTLPEKVRQLIKLDNFPIIGHRGLPGYIPEHSWQSHNLAFYMGADHLEIDVNVTKDKRLVVTHDSFVDDFLNIEDHPEFDSRRETHEINSVTYSNKLWVKDLTVEEIKTFYLVQRKGRPQEYNRLFRVQTLEEYLSNIMELNAKAGKSTGVLLEVKNADYHRDVVKADINEMIAEVLKVFKLNDCRDFENYSRLPIIVQSFDRLTLDFFNRGLGNSFLPIFALVRWENFYNFKDLVGKVDGIGLDLRFVLFDRIDDLLLSDGKYYKDTEEFQSVVVRNFPTEVFETVSKRIMAESSNIVFDYLNELGLKVIIWTLANDHPRFNKEPEIEIAKLRELKAGGIITDFADTGVSARKIKSDGLRDEL